MTTFRNRVVLLLLVVVPLAAGQCEFPTDWRQKWVTKRVGDDVYYQDIKEDKIENRKYTDGSTDQSDLISTYECEDDSQSVPFRYYVLSKPDGSKLCKAAYKGDRVIMSAEIANPDPYQLDATRRFPIPDGTYQMNYLPSGNTVRQCVDDQSSILIVLGYLITVRSCNVPDTIQYGVQYYYVDSFSSAVAGASTSNDPFVVLRKVSDNTIYGARYRIVGYQVYISIDQHSEEAPTVRLTDDATTAGPGYLQVTLTRNECANGACLYGNCTQTLNGFTCACHEGWTGERCDTDLGECMSSPCQYGHCVDGVNSYSCVCYPGWTGTNCETEICNLPYLMFSDDGWWTGYTSSYEEENITFTNEYSERHPSGEKLWCKKSYQEYGQTYAVWFNSDSSLYTCSKITTSYASLLFRHALDGATSTELTISDCMAMFANENNTIPIQVFLRRPLGEHSAGSYGRLVDGTYQMAYQEHSNGSIECQGDPDSMAIIFFYASILYFNSCFSEATTFDRPFSVPILGVADSYAEYEVDGAYTGRGDVVILIYNVTATNLVYSCTRVTRHETQLLLSMNLKTDRYVQCDPLAKSSTARPVPDNHQHIILTSDICERNPPCQNGATCEDKLGGYECKCATGYVGKNCETDFDGCTTAHCYNGGVCEDLVGGYRCECRPGYYGAQCEYYNPCFFNPCVNGGSCSDNGSTYTCSCMDGYSGTRCESDIDECESDPCQYGGTCTDLLNGFVCTCPSGTSGLLCEFNEDNCASNPCQNDGTCADRVNGYFCFCPKEWRGVHCEEYDDCHTDPCLNGAECVDGIDRYRCKCRPGYSGIHCEDAPPQCYEDSCVNGGICVVNGGVTSCECPAHYAGVRCEILQSPCIPNPCQNEGFCDPSGSGFTCRCRDYFSGPRCEYAHQCASKPCSDTARCEPTGDDSYVCRCQDGIVDDSCRAASTGMDVLYIILIVVAAIIIITAIATCCFCFRRR